MKNKLLLAVFLCSVFSIISCKDDRLVEVVEVPLPTKEEKVIIGSPMDVKAEPGSFSVAKLPYAYDALAPTIRSFTLETHYSKHYLGYTNNLNKAVAGTVYENMTIEDILSKLDLNNAALRNNAGGYYNHTLYWKCMTPKGRDVATDTLAGSIEKDFGSFANFTSQFKSRANKQFGSGWAWLVVDKAGKLQITTSDNQDNPLMKNALVPGIPILALDLWEHAYYLDYQYRKKNYIDAFFKIIDWEKVNENYKEALTKIKR
ncbi:superoxide dismutase [Flavobacterium agrisoli]|uniref:Superoxide dismutase n=1 Tax=Flavobacterium agrisoli TaxID=2793066 RepID=A0A934PIU3_9FLAO|nr:superoxide dismutase [Flavobacterium agrisoli]MBK0368892.1 superoxide dismutase [Flavobacterium agrisoli]